jgi:hypothetical protein
VVRLFLKYNPVKLILVFIVLAVIRILAYRMGIPVTDPEITWLLVGERMADGFTLYKDIWTELEPFSAGTYYLIDLIAGKSILVYFVISLLLVFAQAFIFNRGLNENKTFRQNSALPALLYVLFSSLFFDFYTLSPVLLGLTFILLAFNIICVQSRIMIGEDRFFYIGLLTGIASLFYAPFSFFLLFALFSLGLYSNTSVKKQMIMVLAFFFPYIILIIYYFWIDNLGNYYQYTLLPLLNSAPEFLIDMPTIIKIAVLPLLLLIIASAAIVVRGKYIHYQYKIIKITGLWLLAGILAMGIEKTVTPHSFIMFVPPLAFFSAHLFLLASRNKIVSEVFFLAMFGGILLISFYALKKPDSYTKAHLIKTVPKEATKLGVQGKRLLVFGNEKGYYISNQLAGPYLNWSLSAWQFKDLKKYDNVSGIYEVFEINKPDYVVDQDKKMETIMNVIPVLKAQYEKIDSTSIYCRKK